jgi:hypothetical protein
MRKDGEFLVGVVFDLEVRRKPQAFAAVAVISLGLMDIEYGLGSLCGALGLYIGSNGDGSR